MFHINLINYRINFHSTTYVVWELTECCGGCSFPCAVGSGGLPRALWGSVALLLWGPLPLVDFGEWRCLWGLPFSRSITTPHIQGLFGAGASLRCRVVPPLSPPSLFYLNFMLQYRQSHYLHSHDTYI